MTQRRALCMTPATSCHPFPDTLWCPVFVCALGDLRFICVTAFMAQENESPEFHPSLSLSLSFLLCLHLFSFLSLSHLFAFHSFFLSSLSQLFFSSLQLSPLSLCTQKVSLTCPENPRCTGRGPFVARVPEVPRSWESSPCLSLSSCTPACSKMLCRYFSRCLRREDHLKDLLVCVSPEEVSPRSFAAWPLPLYQLHRRRDTLPLHSRCVCISLGGSLVACKMTYLSLLEWVRRAFFSTLSCCFCCCCFCDILFGFLRYLWSFHVFLQVFGISLFVLSHLHENLLVRTVAFQLVFILGISPPLKAPCTQSHVGFSVCVRSCHAPCPSEQDSLFLCLGPSRICSASRFFLFW